MAIVFLVTNHEVEGSMKLYRSKKYPNRWYAYSRETGWVTFPCEANGWEKRAPARGIDPIDIREVPLELASECGVPELVTAD